MRNQTTANRLASLVVYIYLFVSGIWILAGDYLTSFVPAEFYSAGLFSGYENWLVVLLTAGFIYFPVRSGYGSLVRARDAHLEKLDRSLHNDLMTLSGLIDLHLYDHEHNRSRNSVSSLKITQSRIRTLSRVYELFLDHRCNQGIPFHQVAAHMKTANFEGLALHCDEMFLSSTQAVTLGLLVNEMISPFAPESTDKEFPLTVAIKNSHNSTVTVIFRLTDAPDYYYMINRIQDNSKHIEGKIIHTLTQKLGGKPSWKEANNRVTYKVQFKKETDA